MTLKKSTATAIGVTRAHNSSNLTVLEKTCHQQQAIEKYCSDFRVDLIKIINYDTNNFVEKDQWLDDLINELETKELKIDLIIFYSWDRITRNYYGPRFMNFLNYCKFKNIELQHTLGN